MPTYPTLPALPVTAQRTDRFLGLQRQDRVTEGAWADDLNLTADQYPMLAVRKRRALARRVPGEILDILAADTLCILYLPETEADKPRTDGTVFTCVLDCGGDPVRFDFTYPAWPGPLVRMGADIIIPGINCRYNTVTAEQSRIDAVYTPTDQLTCRPCTSDGTPITYDYYYDPDNNPAATTLPIYEEGEYAVSCSTRTVKRCRLVDYSPVWERVENCVRVEASGIGADFLPGDVITIEGLDRALGAFTAQSYSGWNDTPYSGSFTLAAAEPDYIVIKDAFQGLREVRWDAPDGVSVSRTMPVMDFVIEAQNRLWGCRSANGVNELYASALGDWRNWQRYDGLSTASWAGSVGTEGPFTGAVNYNGYPLFFKEKHLHRIYPSPTGAHRVQDVPLAGVAPGCGKSLTVLRGVLYYVSRAGIMVYDGSVPVSISAALGALRPMRAAAGGLGQKLRFSVTDVGGKTELLTYDADRRLWHREGGFTGGVVAFAALGESLYGVDVETHTSCVYDMEGADGAPEENLPWFAESGLIGYAETGQKYISRFVLRMTLPRGSHLDLWIEYDSDGVWRHHGRVRGTGTGSFLIPVRPRRCDHFRLKLEGQGDMRLYSVTKYRRKGSDKP